MTFNSANLHLQPGAVGNLAYIYDAGADTMATVLAAGYFNNDDDDINLAAEDRIWAQCADGNMVLRVSSVNATTGVVTCQYAGGALPPVQTFATGTAANLTQLSVGFYEVGTSIATATRAILPAPYPGAEVIVRKVDSGSRLFTFDAGGSATTAGGGTGVTFDSVGNRRITLNAEGEGFHVVGTSSTRWRLKGMEMEASATGEGGSRFLAGT